MILLEACNSRNSPCKVTCATMAAPPPPPSSSVTWVKRLPLHRLATRRKISSTCSCTALIKLTLATRMSRLVSLGAWLAGCQLIRLTPQSTTLVWPDGQNVCGTKVNKQPCFTFYLFRIKSVNVNLWGWHYPCVNLRTLCEVDYYAVFSSLRSI